MCENWWCEWINHTGLNCSYKMPLKDGWILFHFFSFFLCMVPYHPKSFQCFDIWIRGGANVAVKVPRKSFNTGDGTLPKPFLPKRPLHIAIFRFLLHAASQQTTSFLLFKVKRLACLSVMETAFLEDVLNTAMSVVKQRFRCSSSSGDAHWLPPGLVTFLSSVFQNLIEHGNTQELRLLRIARHPNIEAWQRLVKWLKVDHFLKDTSRGGV